MTGLLLFCHCAAVSPETVDLDRLAQLTSFDDRALESDFQSYLLIFYFNDVDCFSCINRELLYTAQLEDHPALSSLIIVGGLQVSPPIRMLLTGLRRGDQLASPILLEGSPGTAGLGDKIRILLIDTRNGHIEASYAPEYAFDEWAAFEDRVLGIVSDQ